MHRFNTCVWHRRHQALTLVSHAFYCLMNGVHILCASVDKLLEDPTSWKCYIYFAMQCTQNIRIFFSFLVIKFLAGSSSLSSSTATTINLEPGIYPLYSHLCYNVLLCIKLSIWILLGSVLKHLILFLLTSFSTQALYGTDL